MADETRACQRVCAAHAVTCRYGRVAPTPLRGALPNATTLIREVPLETPRRGLIPMRDSGVAEPASLFAAARLQD